MWEAIRDEKSKRVYFANRETKEASWNPPPIGEACVPYPAEDVLANWKAFRSPVHANELFFLNSLTGERVWDRPYRFRGMPEGESEDHDLGPFVQYEDDNDRLFYYNPRTKYVTRSKPSAIISEEKAYEELRRNGVLWEGRPTKEEDTTIKQSNDAKQVRTNHDEESDASSSSSSSSDDSKEEDDDDDEKHAFLQMLRDIGVTKASKWSNWLPKLHKEKPFKEAPQEKVRAWFETFVRDLVASTSADKAKAIVNAKEKLSQWFKENSGSILPEFSSPDFPPMLTSAFAVLNTAEQNAVISNVRKSQGLA